MTLSYNDGLVLVPSKDKEVAAVDIKKMGFTYEKNVFLQAEIPSYIDGSPLIADALLLSDEGRALAVVLCGFSLKAEPTTLHTIAEIYSNSAKKQYGMRPIVVFIENGNCRVINGVLGSMQEEIRPMGAPIFEELVAIHNIQEEEFYDRILKDKELMKAFMERLLNHEEINKELLSVLDKAKQDGYSKYYRENYGTDDEHMKALKNQAVLLLFLGEENYKKHLKSQSNMIKAMLDRRARETLLLSVGRRNWTETEGYSPEMRMLRWTMNHLGWDVETQVKKDVHVPCYYDSKMNLMADYVFFDVNEKPLAVFLHDELNLAHDREFVIAEFYARSFKAEYGMQPMVVVFSQNGAYLKPGALTGGFNRTNIVMHYDRLAVETSLANVVEDYAWDKLMEHASELKKLTDDEQRAKRQLELIEESTKELGDKLSDGDFIAEEYKRVAYSTELKEEKLWKELLGLSYGRIRDKELKRVRIFVADKRMRYMNKKEGKK